MTRGEKTKRFLTGGTLIIGGILTLITIIIGTSSSILQFVIGGIFLLFGLILMSEKSSKLPGIIILIIGGIIIVNKLKLDFFITESWFLVLAAICSLLTGAYLTYTGVKRINSY